MSDADILIRLCAASGAGILLGLDRELRGISAGIRTHALVALSSAVITVSAMLLSDEFSVAHPGQNLDPLRVVQGLAQAIGFIAAGAIFVAKGDVRNLTSAANIWLAASAGIAAGLGQFKLLGMALVLGVIIVTGRARAGAPDPRQRQGAHRLGGLRALPELRFEALEQRQLPLQDLLPRVASGRTIPPGRSRES